MSSALTSILAIAPTLASAVVGGTIGVAGARLNARSSEKRAKRDQRVARCISVKMKVGIISNSVNACVVQRDLSQILYGNRDESDTIDLVHVLDRTPIKFDIEDLEIFLEHNMLETISALMTISSSYATLLYLLNNFEVSYRELQKAGHQDEWWKAQQNKEAMESLISQTPLATIAEENQHAVVSWVHRMSELMKSYKDTILADVHTLTPELANLPSFDEYAGFSANQRNI